MKARTRHRLGDLRQQLGQVPQLVDDAARRAINATLPRGRDAVYAAMRRVFDRPTPYALGALRLELASESGPLAGAVMVKGKQDARGGGIPGQSFLRAEIKGGSRRWKRFEVALMKRGHLPRGWYAVPAKGAKLDAWGNMSRGQVVELMAWLQLFGTGRTGKPYRANKSAKTLARDRAGTRNRFGLDVVLSSPLQAYRRGGLPFGIWIRQTNARTTRTAGAPRPLMPVVLFVKGARYQVRLQFTEELQKATAAEFPDQLARALARARLARPLPDVK